ncbi:MAG: LacI family DNA-binding transcriptional regulator [Micromonosporaceae bacterium]|nr:LacI family DNA-binding transcriptional regulator [Micromonosporaceae bacterium]
MPATIRDVARACGVHVSTVSRTFSAPNLVNPETRSRVLAVAEQLGYRPNKAARALITGRTTNLGLIVADITNPYFPPMIKAAQSQARLHDHHVFVADTDENPAVEEELVRTLAAQVDGILLCSPRMVTRSLSALAQEVPIVVVNRSVDGIPAVLMDLASGARNAIDHLADLGHQHVAYVGGPAVSWTNRELRRAAVAAAKARGIRLHLLGPFPPNHAGGVAAASAVRETPATGVLAFNDIVAIGLLESLREAGVSVPGQISLIGVDDIPQAEIVRLTTIATPTDTAGRAAVDMLLARAAAGRRGGTPADQAAIADQWLPTTLVVRESTGPAPSTKRVPTARTGS